MRKIGESTKTLCIGPEQCKEMAIYGAEEDHVKNIFGDEYQVFSIGRGQLGAPVKHPNEMETKHIGLEFKNCFKVET